MSLAQPEWDGVERRKYDASFPVKSSKIAARSFVMGMDENRIFAHPDAEKPAVIRPADFTDQALRKSVAELLSAASSDISSSPLPNMKWIEEGLEGSIGRIRTEIRSPGE